MVPLRVILHPTDFSACSQHAFGVACALARDHGGRVIAFHVVLPPTVTGGEAISELASQAHRDALREDFRRLTEETDAKAAVELCLQESGDPAQEILRFAEKTKCDLIVMGTHGRGGLNRLLMGSVAEQVLRKATCPVLMVKALTKSKPTTGEG